MKKSSHKIKVLLLVDTLELAFDHYKNIKQREHSFVLQNCAAEKLFSDLKWKTAFLISMIEHQSHRKQSN